jgi:N-acyl-D-amino-acid deacylase
MRRGDEVADFDLIIRNGEIYDGSGGPPVHGDVGVRGDRIEAVGAVSGSAARAIDVAGRAVAPGFIDVHAHDDAAVVWHPALDFKIMQGITTDVVGNCGAGVAPANDQFRASFARGFGGILGESELPWSTVAEYFDAVDAARPACNVAAYVPHGVVRANVMGFERREPTAGELDAMRALVEEAMGAGAIGMSTGLVYPPGAYAHTQELIELARVVARNGGIYTSHIRNETGGSVKAIDEALEIGEQSGCPVQISHHKSAGVAGGTLRTLPRLDAARARGIEVTVDVYPYDASSSSLAAMYRIGGDATFERTPAIIASVKHSKERYEGRYISDIAQELGLPIGETIRRIIDDEEGTPSVIMFTMHEEDVRRVVADPHSMIGSDGLPTRGRPHPRLYGTMARVIEKYVRETPLLTLEEAVRKMTSLPAAKHRIKDRGVLRPGCFADIVVFDPTAIADVATYAEPRQYPTGIDYVIVNGEVAAERGAQTAARAGRALRRGA